MGCDKNKIFLKIITLCALLLLSTSVFSSNLISFEWDELTSIELDKKEYELNEPITGKIIFYNQEEFPSLGTKIVLHLAQGDYDYPSQLNLSENILNEKIVDMDFVLAGKRKETLFSFDNPGSGEFRIDGYVWVVKSKALGASNIFYYPVSENFIVKGNNSKQRLVINRALTVFEEVSGPVGFPINPNEEFSGKVVIDNLTTKEKKDIVVGLKICEWASPFCDEKEEKKFEVSNIPSKGQGFVNVNLIAPTIPSAYEIFINLYSEGELESVYKNRVIVKGGTAKVRKIGLGGIADRNYAINIVLLGSPDHFTYPVFEDFDLKVLLYNENNLIWEKTSKIEKINTGESIIKEFNFDKDIFSKICYLISKNNVGYDEGCFELDLNQILYEYELIHPPKIEAKYNYDEISKNLQLELVKKSATGLREFNARIKIIDSDKAYYSKLIENQSYFKENILMEKLDLFLVIDDLNLKQQQVIPINLKTKGVNVYGESIDTPSNIVGGKKCEGRVCPKDFVCDSKTELTIEGDCCYTNCIESGVFSTEGLIGIPLITWVALIMLVIAIIIVFEAVKKGRKK
ncbi:MAG: hypothetical protein ACOX1V_01220 [Candidatus Iainarchaeum sp.]